VHATSRAVQPHDLHRGRAAAAGESRSPTGWTGPNLPAATSAPARKRLVLGSISIDSLTFAQALDAICDLCASGNGGSVVTPNVDHVVQAEHDPRFRRAYDRASLSLVDGVPLLWAAKLLGEPLPEKISGSDLVMPLVGRAAERGLRVYLLGGAEGVGALAAAKMKEQFPALQVVGIDSPRVDIDGGEAGYAPIVAKVREARPDLVLLALGAPKQEIFADDCAEALKPAVCVGVGATLDFIAGKSVRAPRWMQKIGMEWLHRLLREPGRLWRRYLLRDPEFALIVARTLSRRRAARRTGTGPR
jgi:N-acetylglucosaminyldiphosphoundecaprenol N-acetyl-beta-D-mannosaminyltransferase